MMASEDEGDEIMPKWRNAHMLSVAVGVKIAEMFGRAMRVDVCRCCNYGKRPRIPLRVTSDDGTTIRWLAETPTK